MSAAVYYEMMPNNLVLGSLSGLVLVLVKIIPLPVSTITFVLNMILLVIGYIFIGREFGVKTVLASLMLPMYLRIFEILTSACGILVREYRNRSGVLHDRGWRRTGRLI